MALCSSKLAPQSLDGALSGLWLRAAVAERQYALASRWMRLRAAAQGKLT
jgi:hypothetical protein